MLENLIKLVIYLIFYDLLADLHYNQLNSKSFLN